jgi:SAM-dependent methyltransferase
MDEYFNHKRSEVLEYFPEQADSLLDVGCGNGRTSFFLKETNNLNYVVGIENDPEAYLLSTKLLDKVFRLDLNKIDNINTQIQERFDCILMLDILEHLINPYVLLKDINNLLHDKGTLIISLPNVRHYSILYELLFKNNWEYSKEGILDYTHLRFFTLNSMINMIEAAGYKILEYKSNKQFNRKFKIINWMLLNQISEFSHFQYIFKCVKND